MLGNPEQPAFFDVTNFEPQTLEELQEHLLKQLDSTLPPDNNKVIFYMLQLIEILRKEKG